MRKTCNQKINQRIAVDTEELKNMLSIGRNSACEIGERANAVVRVGRRKLFLVKRIEQYLEQLIDEQAANL